MCVIFSKLNIYECGILQEEFFFFFLAPIAIPEVQDYWIFFIHFLDLFMSLEQNERFLNFDLIGYHIVWGSCPLPKPQMKCNTFTPTYV